MTEPTTQATGSAGTSPANFDTRLEALRLAVKTVENAPYLDDCVVYAYLADGVVFIAERYRVFLEGGAR